MLAIFALESIATLDAQELQDQKAQVMRAMRLWGGEPQTAARRARYTKGSIGGRKIPDYIKEPGVDPKRLDRDSRGDDHRGCQQPVVGRAVHPAQR
ncbi:hypothetical protein BN11_340005 [Nostocoides australiense Ben110]|uniref:Glucose-6-phosphate dehydrogenase C-terminal domain-containing protein n=1 Tax=Nostocoides australiense Ben110 TaxID=1193182 RepID=W6K3U1_9MICO|nr:hypothetical protein [Tetrasphaera australiensis]CCH73854.1 hypothetical protein BN11_340005 [Tetrasphaera australiensis Ben110]